MSRRRRKAENGSFLAWALYREHDTTAMREDEANAVIARVRRSIAARTSEALRRVVIELAPAHTAVALAIREPPFDDLPATVAAVRTSRRLLYAADGMLYQLAICHAARQLSLDVHMCRRGKEAARAAQHLGVTPGEVDEFVSRTGATVRSRTAESGRAAPAGPPWTGRLARHSRTRTQCRLAAVAVCGYAARSASGRSRVRGKDCVRLRKPHKLSPR